MIDHTQVKLNKLIKQSEELHDGIEQLFREQLALAAKDEPHALASTILGSHSIEIDGIELKDLAESLSESANLMNRLVKIAYS